MVLLASAPWLVSHRSHLQALLHRSAAPQPLVKTAAPLTPPPEVTRSESVAPPAAGEPWTVRFSARLRRPAAHPGFYRELFEAGPPAVKQIGARLLDPSALQALRPGDLADGSGGPELALRQDALLLLGVLVDLPRAPAPIRAASADALAAFVEAPPPGKLVPGAVMLAYHERGQALASLLRADPRLARTAWSREPTLLQRALTRVEAKRSLADLGLPQTKVRAALVALAQ